MTSQPPPAYTFSGIDYNPNYFKTDTGSGLSQGKANALYLKKTVADTATALETFSSGIKTSNIDTTISDTSLLIGSTTATNMYFGNTNTNVDFNGYTFFMDVAPNCAITANIDEEMPNKIFVDDRVSQSGSTQLFLNYSASQTGIYKSLDTEIIVTTPSIVTTQQLGTRLISSFLTAIGYPNMTKIPRGIWKLNQYAQLTDNTGTIYYYFKVYKGQIGSFTLLGTSGNSNNLVAGSGIYYSELYLDQQTILATDRILIEIYTVGTGVSDFILSTYQGSLSQGSCLSYITCPLQVYSSNLLSSNNSWTGTNSFTALTTMEGITLSGASNLTIGTGVISPGSFAGTRTNANLGYIQSLTANDGTFDTTGVFKAVASAITIPIGVFIVYGYLEVETFSGTTEINLAFTNLGTLQNSNYGRIKYAPGINRQAYSFTSMITSGGANVVFAVMGVYTGVAPKFYAINSGYKIVRIA